jgi:hypothetical protein
MSDSAPAHGRDGGAEDGGLVRGSHRDDEKCCNALDGVRIVGVADDALRLGPAGSRGGLVGRDLREVHELLDEPGHLLV